MIFSFCFYFIHQEGGEIKLIVKIIFLKMQSSALKNLNSTGRFKSSIRFLKTDISAKASSRRWFNNQIEIKSAISAGYVFSLSDSRLILSKITSGIARVEIDRVDAAIVTGQTIASNANADSPLFMIGRNLGTLTAP